MKCEHLYVRAMLIDCLWALWSWSSFIPSTSTACYRLTRIDWLDTSRFNSAPPKAPTANAAAINPKYEISKSTALEDIRFIFEKRLRRSFTGYFSLFNPWLETNSEVTSRQLSEDCRSEWYSFHWTDCPWDGSERHVYSMFNVTV